MLADNMILQLKVPKDSTRKFLDLINNYRKIAGYKMNIQKSFITRNEQQEFWKTTSFTIAYICIYIYSYEKYIRRNLTKEKFKGLYIENFETNKLKTLKDRKKNRQTSHAYESAVEL